MGRPRSGALPSGHGGATMMMDASIALRKCRRDRPGSSDHGPRTDRPTATIPRRRRRVDALPRRSAHAGDLHLRAGGRLSRGPRSDRGGTAARHHPGHRSPRCGGADGRRAVIRPGEISIADSDEGGRIRSASPRGKSGTEAGTPLPSFACPLDPGQLCPVPARRIRLRRPSRGPIRQHALHREGPTRPGVGSARRPR